jgi:HK97 family phage major capsid protein
MSVELKKKLAQIESNLKELREERAVKVKGRETAKEKFAATEGHDMDSQEFKDAREAVRAVGEIDDQITDLQTAQVEILRMLGEDTGNGNKSSSNGRDDEPGGRSADGWESQSLFTEEVKAQLSQVSGSKSRFGAIQLGTVISRDRLAADPTDPVTGTPWMRRGTYAGVVPQIYRPLRVLDLIPIGTTDGNLVPYTQESGDLDTGAQETAEGDVKPEGDVTFTDAQALVQTIASWQKIQKQALADYAAIQSMIDFRLRYTVMRRLERQILSGDGTGTNLTGILNTSGIGSVDPDSGLPVSELVLTAITNIYIVGAEANGIVMYPSDWQTALTQKAQLSPGPPPVGSGDYVGGGPFMNNPLVMWGVPVLPSPAIPSGKALVGDFAIGAQLLIREGVNVVLSDSDQDDFIRNRVTMLGEMRAALPVWRPLAFQSVDLAD